MNGEDKIKRMDSLFSKKKRICYAEKQQHFYQSVPLRLNCCETINISQSAIFLYIL